MIVYLSGNNVTNLHKKYLASYWYIDNGMRTKDFYIFAKRGKMGEKISLFLDSGAFSAFTKGVEINIYDYIDFIKRHKKTPSMQCGYKERVVKLVEMSTDVLCIFR